MSVYDLVTIGGGLGGAALARSMALAGAKVLVLERTTDFNDRVRGEVLVPWGCEEADRLGLYDILHDSCGHELSWWSSVYDGTPVLRRDLRDTTAKGFPTLTYYHPTMQALVWEAAGAAGAEMLRGAKATEIVFGTNPRVAFNVDGVSREVEARMIVGADGRSSAVRKWGDFTVQSDEQRRFFAGVLMEDHPAPDDAMTSYFLSDLGLMSWIFPQGDGRVRTYLGFAADSDLGRLSGQRDMQRFITEQVRTGVPAEYLSAARVAGPLATFDGTDNWVEHPYKDGLALIGDAAATGDPTWGQGMAQTLRDVRLLCEALIQCDDWNEAGHRYAELHDEGYEHTHRADRWLTDLFLDTGAQAESRRARALPKILEDSTRLIDTGLSGPRVLADEAAHRRMFGEDS